MASIVLIASSVSFAYLLFSAFLDLPTAAKLDYAAYPGLFLLTESVLFFVISLSSRIVFLRYQKKAALPDAEEKTNSKESAERGKKRKVLSLDGLSCGHCAMKIESALLDVPGVESVRVDLLARSAFVSGHELKDSELISSVEKAGYRVTGILGHR